MTTLMTVGLFVLAIMLWQQNVSLRTRVAEITKKYQAADKRASILYDANMNMRRVQFGKEQRQ